MSPLDFLSTKKEVESPAVKPQEAVKKEDPKSEKNNTVQTEKSGMQNVVIHSELDAFLMDRIKAQPDTLEEVEQEIIVQPKDGRHALTLPDELNKHTNKYAFCWIFKRKQAIDEACDLYHYKLVNRMYFPEIPNHLFTARGTMERGDNILVFRSKKIDEEMRKAPGLESNERIKARTKAHEGDPNFYVPKAESKDEGHIVGV